MFKDAWDLVQKLFEQRSFGRIFAFIFCLLIAAAAYFIHTRYYSWTSVEEAHARWILLDDIAHSKDRLLRLQLVGADRFMQRTTDQIAPPSAANNLAGSHEGIPEGSPALAEQAFWLDQATNAYRELRSKVKLQTRETTVPRVLKKMTYGFAPYFALFVGLALSALFLIEGKKYKLAGVCRAFAVINLILGIVSAAVFSFMMTEGETMRQALPLYLATLSGLLVVLVALAIVFFSFAVLVGVLTAPLGDSSKPQPSPR